MLSIFMNNINASSLHPPVSIWNSFANLTMFWWIHIGTSKSGSSPSPGLFWFKDITHSIIVKLELFSSLSQHNRFLHATIFPRLRDFRNFWFLYHLFLIFTLFASIFFFDSRLLLLYFFSFSSIQSYNGVGHIGFSSSAGIESVKWEEDSFTSRFETNWAGRSSPNFFHLIIDLSLLIGVESGTSATCALWRAGITGQFKILGS